MLRIAFQTNFFCHNMIHNSKYTNFEAAKGVILC